VTAVPATTSVSAPTASAVQDGGGWRWRHHRRFFGNRFFGSPFFGAPFGGFGGFPIVVEVVPGSFGFGFDGFDGGFGFGGSCGFGC
jgi:hypothetical protein